MYLVTMSEGKKKQTLFSFRTKKGAMGFISDAMRLNEKAQYAILKLPKGIECLGYKGGRK